MRPTQECGKMQPISAQIDKKTNAEIDKVVTVERKKYATYSRSDFIRDAIKAELDRRKRNSSSHSTV